MKIMTSGLTSLIQMSEMNKRQLTLSYIKAFNDKNLDEVLLLCDENIYLKDPNNELFNKKELKDFLLDFFKNDISFSAKEIITDDETKHNHSTIHFTLKVNDKTFDGVDIIKWKDDKIVSLIAYL
jgi:hypothetical protein